ncbi:hypothetical protein KIN20_003368 [Parelaphostrongylus tenuis]|uniref:Uncharacterized protein n=1 Tax=Parelaphostrongylus tenuis TaxID=148309 RepID=A0AAD5MI61_PARTN|nr:hypothetical protein KIN20_003368 [Parelaphostrongylus tenuis]
MGSSILFVFVEFNGHRLSFFGGLQKYNDINVKSRRLNHLQRHADMSRFSSEIWVFVLV